MDKDILIQYNKQLGTYLPLNIFISHPHSLKMPSILSTEYFNCTLHTQKTNGRTARVHDNDKIIYYGGNEPWAG